LYLLAPVIEAFGKSRYWNNILIDTLYKGISDYPVTCTCPPLAKGSSSLPQQREDSKVAPKKRPNSDPDIFGFYIDCH